MLLLRWAARVCLLRSSLFLLRLSWWLHSVLRWTLATDLTGGNLWWRWEISSCVFCDSLEFYGWPHLAFLNNWRCQWKRFDLISYQNWYAIKNSFKSNRSRMLNFPWWPAFEASDLSQMKVIFFPAIFELTLSLLSLFVLRVNRFVRLHDVLQLLPCWTQCSFFIAILCLRWRSIRILHTLFTWILEITPVLLSSGPCLSRGDKCRVECYLLIAASNHASAHTLVHVFAWRHLLWGLELERDVSRFMNNCLHHWLNLFSRAWSMIGNRLMILKDRVIGTELLQACFRHYNVLEPSNKEWILAWLQKESKYHEYHAALRL